MERHLTKRLQQENQCLSTSIGESTSKSIFYPASQQHLLFFQLLTGLLLRLNIWDEAQVVPVSVSKSVLRIWMISK